MEIYLSNKQKEYIKQLINISKIKNKMILKIFNDDDIKNYSFNKTSNIDDIINVLSFSFSDEKRKNSGITFTPIDVVKYMYSNVLNLPINKIIESNIIDISLGNGSFFVGLIIYLKLNDPQINLYNFVKAHLYGMDIQEENIQMAELILSIVLEYYGEDKEEYNFNFLVNDSLKYYINNKPIDKFDIVVGNPPYVKQQNLKLDYRKFLEDNFTTISSNYNLYYAFIEVSLSIVKKTGKVLLLVPNYILKIKSAQNLRKLLLTNKSIQRIVDFGHSKIFPRIDTYSMILELCKNSDKMEYKRMTEEQMSIDNIEWSEKNLNKNNIETINLTNREEDYLINKVQNQDYDMDISTGIATQKDKLYLIDDVKKENNKIEFIKEYNQKRYYIEEELISPIIKGSGASKKANSKKKYIIFPYKVVGKDTVIIEDNEMKTKFPNAWEYFCDVKSELMKRSGIKNGVNPWYAYGRSQALNKTMPKIVFPTNSDKPKFRFYEDKALFYNGYAIFGLKNKKTDVLDMKCINIILNSELINKFMHLTSYYIGGGYISYQKKYLSKVKIPKMTKEEKSELIYLQTNNKEKIDEFVRHLYYRE